MKKGRSRLEAVRVVDGGGFRLADHDPRARSGLDHSDGDRRLQSLRERLGTLQARLYASGRHSLLVVLQGMDTSGKDGTIGHVTAGLNPQGVDVVSFKQPGPIELAHHFLWRVWLHAPALGRIVIFNRSHYEDVLVTRVHPELLPEPPDWEARFDDIRGFERALAHGGTTVVKCFLHISRDEQEERLRARLDDPAKHWKWSGADLRERARWDDYQRAYEEAIAATATEAAPWFVVPADHKWHARLLVAEAMVEALEGIDPQLPPVDKAAIRTAKKELGRVASSRR